MNRLTQGRLLDPLAFTAHIHKVSFTSAAPESCCIPTKFYCGDALRPYITKALSKALHGKETGGDYIFVEMFHADKDLGIEILTKVWEKVGQVGTIPLSWQETILVPIHKKGSPNDRGNYRPTALLLHARKIIESALDICIRKH